MLWIELNSANFNVLFKTNFSVDAFFNLFKKYFTIDSVWHYLENGRRSMYDTLQECP